MEEYSSYVETDFHYDFDGMEFGSKELAIDFYDDVGENEFEFAKSGKKVKKNIMKKEKSGSKNNRFRHSVEENSLELSDLIDMNF